MSPTWFSVCLVLFMAFVWTQRLLETFAKRQVIQGDRLLRWSFPLMMLLHSAIFVGSLVEYFVAQRPIFYSVSAAGVLLYVVSLALRTAAIRTLGQYFSLHIEIRKKHQLIRNGVYGHVRHPIYSAVALELLSVPLVANAWFMALLTLVCYLPLLALRLRREEIAMIEKFGEEYRAYQRTTGALIPRWPRRHATAAAGRTPLA